MQICRSISLFCARLFCCVPSQPRTIPHSPSSQQMLELVVTHLAIEKASDEPRLFFDGLSKTTVTQYDCTLTFDDRSSGPAQLTRHKISQLMVTFSGLSLDNHTDELFTESLVAESVNETESPEVWLRSIKRSPPSPTSLPASPSLPSLHRMDTSSKGIKLETIRED